MAQMHRRISLLVASGFALLLGLGLMVSVITMTGLRATVERADASQASALEVRAAVRSLRADYLESADAIARILLDPSHHDAHAAKRESDANAARHLASAESASRRADLRALLDRLRRHDAAATDRIEEKLLALAGSAPAKARRVYLTHYLRARAFNLELVRDALQLASDEVAEAARLTQSKASSTLLLAQVMLAVFLVLGLTSGFLLSHAVSTIARRFERAAGEVTEQRDHLQAVMTAMQDSLIVVDAAGTVTTLNDGTCQLLGCTPAEIVGQPIARFVETAPGEPIDPTRGADARGQRMTYRAKGGEAIPVSASAAALRDGAGGVVGAVCVAHDMRDHERMLAEVASARDAALEGSRIKSEFLANVSHEIRTPMNVIIGYTDIVMESDLEAFQRESLGRVRNAAVALLDIINDVLDISKVEAGKLTVERVPFDVRAVVGDIVGSLMLRAQEKGLGLDFEIAPEVSEQVIGDPTRLRQVLLNLVSNAIKFTERGEVIVHVAREPSAEAAMLRFSVIDTGIGIPRDKQEVIFQAFTQADGSMNRRFGGTGLGLTIAARLVGLMGGRIWVESTVGRGSTFHFTLQADLDRDGLAA
jgi:PAS domain S-box-containing protein